MRILLSALFCLTILPTLGQHHPKNSWQICDPDRFISVYTEPVPMNLSEVNDWLKEETVSGIPEGLFEWSIRVFVSERGRVIRSRAITEGVEHIPPRLLAGLDSLRFIPANENGAPTRFWINIDVSMTRGAAQFNLPQVSLPTNLEEVYQQLADAISQPAVVCHLGVSFRGKVTKVYLSAPISDDEKELIEQIVQELTFKLQNLGRGLHITIFKRYPDFREKQQTVELEPYNPDKQDDPGYHGVLSDLAINAHSLNDSDLMRCINLPASFFESADSAETVIFRLQISEEGQLFRIVGIFGNPKIWDAMLPCLRQLRFSPAYRAGQPVDSWLEYPVDLCWDEG